MIERWAHLTIWKPCKHCGRNDTVDTRCSRCGGHGLVGYESPYDCPGCGGDGHEWPPRCTCGAFRGALYAAFVQWDSTPFEAIG